MTVEISKIRNVGVVGHGGVGKTSLVEALLFATGAVTRLGRVDDGSTTTDFDPDEIKRKISINTSIAYCDWKGHRINLVDTPGYGDFIADARAGLRVVEAAVVVVDAVAGVQVQTEKVWKFATEFNLPRVVVVNRLDRERSDFFRTLESLGRRLKGRLVALHIPLGEESGFRGFVDLVKMKAVTVAGGKPVGFASVALDAFHERMGVVDIVGVDPDYQRCGIARQLMEHSVDFMRDRGMDIAAVGTGGDVGHAPARALYEALDYTALPGVRYLKLL